MKENPIPMQPYRTQPRPQRPQRTGVTRAPLAGLLLALGTLRCQPAAPAVGAAAPVEPAAANAPEQTPAASAAALSEPRRATGRVRVVSADADALQRPTTAAFRGSTLWVSIGQLSALFETGKAPRLPFGALSLSLGSGTFGPERVALPGSDYYPEGITAAADGTLFIGSIMQGLIMKVPPESSVAVPFLPQGVAQRGVLGVTVDAARQLLWFCDSNPKLAPEKKAGDLVGVRLTDAHEVVRHALPALDGKPPFCNDVIVATDGNVWLTESASGRVFRIAADAALRPDSAESWLVGGEIGPPPSSGSGANGIEQLGRHLIVANVGRGTLVALDPESQAAERGARTIELVDAETQAPIRLCSPDGLETVPGSTDTLVVVENGGCETKTARISQVTLAL
jgi:sugar lactone lactonase YvrE